MAGVSEDDGNWVSMVCELLTGLEYYGQARNCRLPHKLGHSNKMARCGESWWTLQFTTV